MELLLLLALIVVVVGRYGSFGPGWRAVGMKAFHSAIILGAIGFVLGFFGPMIFAPGANQGPMLGIFITGPGGFVLGLFWGGGRELLRQRSERQA